MLRYLLIYVCVLFSGSMFAKEYSFVNIPKKAGLANSRIRCIHKDGYGFMWFGTHTGLSRYDGYNIINYKSDKSDTTSLADNNINDLCSDSSKRIFVATNRGVSIFNYANETFDNRIFGRSERVVCLKKDEAGSMWLANGSGEIFMLDSFFNVKEEFITKKLIDVTEQVRVLRYNNNGFIVITSNSGIYRFSFDDRKYERLCDNFEGDNSFINNIIQLNNKEIWFSTFQNGIYILKNNRISNHIKLDNIPGTLNYRYITGLVRKTDNTVWVLTDGGGIVEVNVHNYSTRNIRKEKYNYMSISSNFLQSAYVANDGIIWIGSVKNGVDKLIDSPFFSYIESGAGDSNGLSNMHITALYHDGTNLWIGTDGNGLDVMRPDGKIEHLPIHKKLKTISKINLIGDVLYLGSYNHGLFSYNLKTKKVFHHKEVIKEGVNPTSLYLIDIDLENRLWVGGDRLVRLKSGNYNREIKEEDIDKVYNKRACTYFRTSDNRELVGMLSGLYKLEKGELELLEKNNSVFNIVKGLNNRIWYSSANGIHKYDLETHERESFHESDGLIDNNVTSMANDNRGNIWIGTLKGLSRFDIKSEKFVNFTYRDGFADNEFSRSSVVNIDDRIIFFGGSNGLLKIHPESVSMKSETPKVTFTNLMVNDEKVKLSDGVIDGYIADSANIVLSYDKRIFTVEFNNFDYRNSENIKYAYKLTGVNEGYVTTDKNYLTFMNLEPGDYKLHVKASLNEREWGKESSILKIKVLPAWWQTLWFRILMGALVLGIIIYININISKRRQVRREFENEKYLLKKQKEIDDQQLRFFTNLSHEIRTPLTLIMSPVESALKNVAHDSELHDNLMFVKNNSIRMKKLIEKIIDFRKSEFKAPELNAKRGDIVAYLRTLIYQFEALFRQENISLHFICDYSKITISFDDYMFETIIYNLLSNAYKYTPSGGDIVVGISRDGGNLIITVKDSGRGIPEDEQAKIFERFYQAEDSSGGTGIGLALTKRFVDAHNGIIELDSVYGEYCKFIIRLPMDDQAEVEESGTEENSSVVDDDVDNTTKMESEASKIKEFTILIVEDEVDIRQYISKNLDRYYRVISASNGVEALEYIKKEMPDIIISDVMMPEMDGVELLKRVRKESSAIPFIMLTAKTMDADKIEAYSEGVDSYLEKPFSIDILMERVKNLLNKKREAKQLVHKELIIEPEDINSSDKLFLDKAVSVVEANISDNSFSTSEFVNEMGMSRSYVYNRVKEVTGSGVGEFINEIRMNHAKYMLQNTNKTVAEIADQIGFVNAKYFSTSFKRMFGVTPTNFRKEGKV